MKSSEYINKERRDYALYVLNSRAIPSATDGLKYSGRRVLWTARDGKKYKSATLAGATMNIHPHATPEGTINTLAAPYGNNIPLLSGDGAFGTLLSPTSYGASRYTSVKISQFTKDVVFHDIDIIPMQENYDGTLLEPKHFLPLIPIVLLNPQEGIAVGFATNILPRDITSIIKSQILYLEDKKVKQELPSFPPTRQYATDFIVNDEGQMTKFTFVGEFKKINATTIEVTNLPYGTFHEKYTTFLNKLEEEEDIQEVEDNSQDQYSITIRFKKGILNKMSNEEILKYVGLNNTTTENMTMVDFNGENVFKTSYSEFIKKFCDWRLEWYVKRYEKLIADTEIDIQRYQDIVTAIKKNVNNIAKKVASRSELKAFLEEIGIVNLDYIADLPIYRFTEDERVKVEQKLEQTEVLKKTYDDLLTSPLKRRKVFIDELVEVLSKVKKGVYSATT